MFSNLKNFRIIKIQAGAYVTRKIIGGINLLKINVAIEYVQMEKIKFDKSPKSLKKG